MNRVLRGIMIAGILSALAAAFLMSFIGCATAPVAPVPNVPSVELYERTQPPGLEWELSRTVKVFALCPQGISRGTGVAVEPKLVITAKHIGHSGCVFTISEGTGPIKSWLGDHIVSKRREAKEGVDAVALELSTPLEHLDLLVPVQLQKPALGQHVRTVGWPVDRWTETGRLTVTEGVVSALVPEKGYVRIQAPIFSGNSGGGCWDPYTGRLLGMTNAMYGQVIDNEFIPYEGYYFVTPAEDLFELLYPSGTPKRVRATTVASP